MQHLDPNRPHGLDDVIERVLRSGEHRPPSWADVCRVREYVGEAWATMRERSGSDYGLAVTVLHHLVDVDGARMSVEPYLTIGCQAHGAPAGSACGENKDGAFTYTFLGSEPDDLSLPPLPLVCAQRVLAKHDRLAAMELFERPRPARPPQDGPSRADHSVLPISAELENDVAVGRVQQRHPVPLTIERLFLSQGSDWTICDIRVDGRSALTPHHDLPGFLFGNRVAGPHLPLPVVDQDQWIEIVARRVCGDAPRFYAGIMGSH